MTCFMWACVLANCGFISALNLFCIVEAVMNSSIGSMFQVFSSIGNCTDSWVSSHYWWSLLTSIIRFMNINSMLSLTYSTYLSPFPLTLLILLLYYCSISHKRIYSFFSSLTLIANPFF